MSEVFFSSVTIWQGEGWEIDALVDGFDTVLAAASFGSNVRSLVRESARLILIDGDGECLELNDSQVQVFQLKPESVGKRMVSRNDFVLKQIPIELFSEVEGLNKTFGSLAYEVLERNLTPAWFVESSLVKPVDNEQSSSA